MSALRDAPSSNMSGKQRIIEHEAGGVDLFNIVCPHKDPFKSSFFNLGLTDRQREDDRLLGA